jgi:Protein of unknown function (DUF3761)
MKTAVRLMALATGLLAMQVSLAQAPAGATGQCKDGTYTTATNKSGACRGHQGVKEWFATSAPAAAAAAPGAAASTAKSSAAAAPAAASGAAKSTASHVSTATTEQAPGGGPGMVWLNTATNVYHCPGTQYYGKTKAGAYMTEAEAKAKGAHADHNKPCGK